MKHAKKVIYKFPKVDIWHTDVGARIKREQKRLAELAKSNVVVAIRQKRKAS